MHDRLGCGKAEWPSLSHRTQAGGKLAVPFTRKFLDIAQDRGLNFFVMYGQTEAAPRISCVPPERLTEKLGSAGLALPGGDLVAAPPTRCTTEAVLIGQIVSLGPSVLLGYHQARYITRQVDV